MASKSNKNESKDSDTISTGYMKKNKFNLHIFNFRSILYCIIIYIAKYGIFYDYR